MKKLAYFVGHGTSASPAAEVIRSADGRYILSVRDSVTRHFANVDIPEADLNRFALEILVATGAVGGPFAQPVGDKVGPVTRSGEIDPTPVEEPRIHHVYGNPPAPKLVSSDDPEFHTLSIG